MDRDKIIEILEEEIGGWLHECIIEKDSFKVIADKIKALEPTEEEILKECDIYHEKVIKGWRKYHRAFILGANFVRNFKR